MIMTDKSADYWIGYKHGMQNKDRCYDHVDKISDYERGYSRGRMGVDNSRSSKED